MSDRRHLPTLSSAMARSRSLYASRAPRILTLLLGSIFTWVLLEFLVVFAHSPPGRPIWIALHLGYFWVAAYWEAAVLRAALTPADSVASAVGSVFDDHPSARAVLALKLLLVPAITLGLALLVLPGLWVAARFGLASFFAVDRALGPLEALARCGRATRGHTVRLMTWALALIVFNLLGAALLGIGLALTVPLTVLMLGEMYTALASEEAAT